MADSHNDQNCLKTDECSKIFEIANFYSLSVSLYLLTKVLLCENK